MFRLPTKRIAPHLWSKIEPVKKPRVLITVPTWNEEIVIAKTIQTLLDRVSILLPGCLVTVEIADNGSTDRTREIIKDAITDSSVITSRPTTKQSLYPTETGDCRASSDCARNDNRKQIRILLLELHEKGKGMAIRRSWEKHLADFDVLVFMDADLASDLTALTELVNLILNNQADLVCGSRFVSGSKIERKLIREAASRLFSYLQKLILDLPVKDAQCGFKAISAKAAKELLPFSREETWLFDSELIALAQKQGYRMQEVPVSWVEDRDPRRKSAVKLWLHGWGFLLGLFKIRWKIKDGVFKSC